MRAREGRALSLRARLPAKVPTRPAAAIERRIDAFFGRDSPTTHAGSDCCDDVGNIESSLVLGCG